MNQKCLRALMGSHSFLKVLLNDYLFSKIFQNTTKADWYYSFQYLGDFFYWFFLWDMAWLRCLEQYGMLSNLDYQLAHVYFKVSKMSTEKEEAEEKLHEVLTVRGY